MKRERVKEKFMKDKGERDEKLIKRMRVNLAEMEIEGRVREMSERDKYGKSSLSGKDAINYAIIEIIIKLLQSGEYSTKNKDYVTLLFIIFLKEENGGKSTTKSSLNPVNLI